MKIINSIMAVCAAVLISGCASSQPAALSPIKAPNVWYQVLPGMTMEQAHAILGQPQSKTDIQEVYRAAGHWELTIAYGNDGKVRSVVDHQNTK